MTTRKVRKSSRGIKKCQRTLLSSQVSQVLVAFAKQTERSSSVKYLRSWLSSSWNNDQFPLLWEARLIRAPPFNVDFIQMKTLLKFSLRGLSRNKYFSHIILCSQHYHKIISIKNGKLFSSFWLADYWFHHKNIFVVCWRVYISL